MTSEEDRATGTARNRFSMATVGARIRQLRRDRGLSLDDLATMSAVSRSMLSSVELGQKAPTVLVIDRIAGALGVNVSRLLAAEEKPAPVVLLTRDAQQIVSEQSGWHRRIVSPVVHGCEFELGRVEFEAHVDAGTFAPHRPGWTEYVVVERGRLEVTLNHTDAYLLQTGDSLYFESDVVHAFRNPAKAVAVAYVGMLGPSSGTGG
ncbi:helix-turn-helix domain-containing protein [Mycolicibacterium goodii]|uniref:helix-turn-helix domain-containing protein n=1 Tax=Mycolicibacterium goodii TaxID=134601 RepID=UPI001BDCB05A|nr:XRE family transcriptional regulator [Mycolicibacterium goodii]MBU8819670.1 XRE family transcriptional regulator [Mycolicibacterium goodii]MBU8833974.1 XRE family transcriptional regulator [Mycolicibacterium goodii]